MLGPHVVGQRVVIRRILPGQTGPTGGPAFTDVLGICESWADGLTVVRRENGEAVRIRTALIVSGKPVPPRPSRFSRLRAEEVEQQAAGSFRPARVRRMGDWLLRYSGGSNRRASSVLAVGDPGLPLEEALAEVAAFQHEHDQEPTAQVVVGSKVQRWLEERGWRRLDPSESDTDVLLAGVAALGRRLRGLPEHGSSVHRADSLSREWLVGNQRALDNFEAVAATLHLDEAVFVSLHDADGRQVARGRVNLVENATDIWALFADLTVQPDRRREGLARALMAEANGWAAEQGAGTMLLSVQADNTPAQSLYASLGFERHHSYRYLVPPQS